MKERILGWGMWGLEVVVGRVEEVRKSWGRVSVEVLG